jgi:hypothetical protein
MIAYRVTWFNTKTGNFTSINGRANDIDHARQSEERAMRLLNRANPDLRLHSVEARGKSTVAA